MLPGFDQICCSGSLDQNRFGWTATLTYEATTIPKHTLSSTNYSTRYSYKTMNQDTTDTTLRSDGDEEAHHPHTGPDYKDQVRSASSGPLAGSASSSTKGDGGKTKAASLSGDDANAGNNNDDEEIPIAEGRLMEPDEATTPSGNNISGNTDPSQNRDKNPGRYQLGKHAIWALALVCVAVVAGVIVAVVLTVGDDDGDGESTSPATTVVVVSYVQIFLSPVTEMLSGDEVVAFEQATDQFYEETLPENTLSEIQSRLVDQFLDLQELTALVEVNGTTTSTTLTAEDPLEPTLLSDAITENESAYIATLQAQQELAETLANVTSTSAVPAAAPQTVEAPPPPPPVPVPVVAPTAPVPSPVAAPVASAPFVEVPPTSAVDNDVCQDAVIVTPRDDNMTAVVVGSTVGANPAPTTNNLYNGGPVVYYQFTTVAGPSRRIRVSTCTPETDFDTGLYVSDSTLLIGRRRPIH